VIVQAHLHSLCHEVGNTLSTSRKREQNYATSFGNEELSALYQIYLALYFAEHVREMQMRQLQHMNILIGDSVTEKSIDNSNLVDHHARSSMEMTLTRSTDAAIKHEASIKNIGGFKGVKAGLTTQLEGSITQRVVDGDEEMAINIMAFTRAHYQGEWRNTDV
jgi:hypothetical protein